MMTRRLLARLAALVAVLAAAAPSPALPPVLAPADMLASAEQAMDDAARAAAADDPELAEDLYEQAAARYESLIESHELGSAPLYRALGNARLLSGDVGRAILSYRRALRLDPTDTRAAASLEHARSRVRTAISPDLAHRALRAALWWQGRIPRSALFAVFVAAFAAAWALEIARVVRARGFSPLWTIAAATLCLACLGSLLVERYATESVEHVVLIRRDTVARTGPSPDVYPPAFDQPMDAGVEATALEHRDGWTRIRLADGREAWVPDTAIARV